MSADDLLPKVVFSRVPPEHPICFIESPLDISSLEPSLSEGSNNSTTASKLSYCCTMACVGMVQWQYTLNTCITQQLFWYYCSLWEWYQAVQVSMYDMTVQAVPGVPEEARTAGPHVGICCLQPGYHCYCQLEWAFLLYCNYVELEEKTSSTLANILVILALQISSY